MSVYDAPPFICPSRSMTADAPEGPAVDKWVEGFAGARCSYCHCLEPEFFLSLCDRVVKGEDELEVVSSSRRGVWVVRRPGVRAVGFTVRHLRGLEESDLISALVRIRRAVRESEGRRFWESTQAEFGGAV